MRLTQCPVCGRAMTMLRDGELANHGPGPDGEFACPGSGDPAFVSAASHLHVEQVPPTQERPLRSTDKVQRCTERRR
jgi:hypothetical protein